MTCPCRDGYRKGIGGALEAAWKADTLYGQNIAALKNVGELMSCR